MAAMIVMCLRKSLKKVSGFLMSMLMTSLTYDDELKKRRG